MGSFEEIEKVLKMNESKKLTRKFFLLLSVYFRRPDLVVGAPFYVDKKGAGGAVYVYLNPIDGFQNNTPYVRLTGPTESRFGYAISTIGDLNKDGFDDLAVGAPYAEDGTGYVYIYLGSKTGVIIEPSQVIFSCLFFFLSDII